MKGRRLFLALALAALVALALTGAASADSGGRPLSTTLTGAAEVPRPGDPDGSGVATITVNPGQEEVCWEISAQMITLPATAAHIHEGAAGIAGDVVVTLSAPNARGLSSGCTTVERNLALDILMNPENYYVNVHTTDFEDGAIRGQLS